MGLTTVGRWKSIPSATPQSDTEAGVRAQPFDQPQVAGAGAVAGGLRHHTQTDGIALGQRSTSLELYGSQPLVVLGDLRRTLSDPEIGMTYRYGDEDSLELDSDSDEV